MKFIRHNLTLIRMIALLVLLSFLLVPFISADISTGLVYNLTFEGNTTYDTANGSTWRNDCPFQSDDQCFKDQCVYCDDSVDELETANADTYLDGTSFSVFWTWKPEINGYFMGKNLGGSWLILGKDANLDDIQIYSGSGWVYGQDGVFSPAMSDGNWHIHGVVFNGGNAEVFYDNHSVDNLTVSPLQLSQKFQLSSNGQGISGIIAYWEDFKGYNTVKTYEDYMDYVDYMQLSEAIAPDVTAPTIELVSPANGSLQPTPFTITFNVTDDGSNDMMCQLNKDILSFSYEPLALWRFEQINTSTVLDSSLNGFDGKVIDNMYSADSKGNNATGNYSREGDGVNDFINISDPKKRFNFGNAVSDLPFSAGGWIYMEDATVFRFISVQEGTGYGNTWAFFTDNTDTGRLQLYDSTTSHLIGRSTNNSYMTQFENKWTHFFMTYDGSGTTGGINIYVNGKIADTQNLVTGSYVAMHNSSSSLGICVINQLGSISVCDGAVDEVSIFDEQLTQEEVQEIMNSGYINESFTYIYDYGSFGQDQSVYINYSSTLPNDFNLQCWDNSPANNTAFIGLYYDTDSIDPVLNVSSPSALDSFPIDISNITFLANCTDVNLDILNVSLYNSTDYLFTNSTSLTHVQGLFNVTNVGVGTYTVEYNCLDTVDNKASEIFNISFSDSPMPIITLISPIQNRLYSLHYDEFPLDVAFAYNITNDANCSLYLNDIYNQSYITPNSTISYMNTSFGNDTTSIDWYINCYDGLYNKDSSTRTFSIEILPEPIVAPLRFNECPQDIPNVILFVFVFFIGIILIIGSIVFRALGLGFIGSLILFFWGTMFIACHFIIGIIFMIVSILFMWIMGVGMVKSGDL